MFILQDSDVRVTYDDQQKINLFARTNARLQDLKEELDSKKARIIHTVYCYCVHDVNLFITVAFKYLHYVLAAYLCYL